MLARMRLLDLTRNYRIDDFMFMIFCVFAFLQIAGGFFTPKALCNMHYMLGMLPYHIM